MEIFVTGLRGVMRIGDGDLYNRLFFLNHGCEVILSLIKASAASGNEGIFFERMHRVRSWQFHSIIVKL